MTCTCSEDRTQDDAETMVIARLIRLFYTKSLNFLISLCSLYFIICCVVYYNSCVIISLASIFRQVYLTNVHYFDSDVIF